MGRGKQENEELLPEDEAPGRAQTGPRVCIETDGTSLV
jgi:hypothetical protein